MTEPRIVAIIPARGGSKGIKRKNLAMLAGKSLLEWTVRYAQKALFIDNVYVTTDNNSIAEAAHELGAVIIKRPKELAEDWSIADEAVVHALPQMGDPDIVVLLQCTSPLRRACDLDNAIDKFLSMEWDSLFSACHMRQFAWHPTEMMRLMYDHTDKRPMRQDRMPALVENGSFYITKTFGYTEFNNRVYGNIGYHVMPWWCGIEIDTEVDLELCELIMRSERFSNLLGADTRF